jgi:hypothetical protein
MDGFRSGKVPVYGFGSGPRFCRCNSEISRGEERGVGDSLIRGEDGHQKWIEALK